MKTTSSETVPCLNASAETSTSNQPITGKRQKRWPQRPLPPTAQEIDAILAEVAAEPDGQDVQDIVAILFQTGMRRGEIGRLRWDNVNFEDRCITILSGRSLQARYVPLGVEVAALLQARRDRKINSDHVVGPTPTITLYKVGRRFSDLSRRILGRRLTLHSLRHAFAAA